MENVFHLALIQEWKDSKNKSNYEPESIQLEGFIHCSTREQLIDTANRFFKGRTDLILLEINPCLLKSKLEFDLVPELNIKFPHIYGPLNRDAIINEYEFQPNQDGDFKLPHPLYQFS